MSAIQTFNLPNLSHIPCLNPRPARPDDCRASFIGAWRAGSMCSDRARRAHRGVCENAKIVAPAGSAADVFRRACFVGSCRRLDQWAHSGAESAPEGQSLPSAQGIRTPGAHHAGRRMPPAWQSPRAEKLASTRRWLQGGGCRHPGRFPSCHSRVVGAPCRWRERILLRTQLRARGCGAKPLLELVLQEAPRALCPCPSPLRRGLSLGEPMAT